MAHLRAHGLRWSRSRRSLCSRCARRGSSTASTPASCLSRADTRALARAWMVAHVPVGAQVVVEPIVPDEWVQDVGHPTLTVPDGDRWLKYRSLLSRIAPVGRARARRRPRRQPRGLRAHARPRADPLLRARRLLLGGERLRGVRPRVRRPARVRRSRSPTTARSRAQGKSSTTPRPTAPARVRWRSTSTGPSTTTRSPTTARAPKCRSTGCAAGAARTPEPCGAEPAERGRLASLAIMDPAMRRLVAASDSTDASTFTFDTSACAGGYPGQLG